MTEEGRPKACTVEQLLDAIATHKTTNAKTLAQKMKCSAKTIRRRLGEVGPEAITAALGEVAQHKIKPSEMKLEVFRELDIVKQFYETLRFKREATEKYSQEAVGTLFRICVLLQKHPDGLTIEDASALMVNIRKGEVTEFGRGDGVKKTMRGFLAYMKNVSRDKLTTEGIDAKLPRKSKLLAQIKLTQEQRHRFLEEVKAKTQENWIGKGAGIISHKINFKDNPVLAKAMRQLPPVLFYTMTRAEATLESCWEIEETKDQAGHIKKYSGVSWEAELVTIRVLDKGKRGGLEWDKHLRGEAATEFKTYWEEIDRPQTGLIFPFAYPAAKAFFEECYQAAGIPESFYSRAKGGAGPFHLWRHTGGQELLNATEWNFALVAAEGGWDSIDALKKNYGEIPPEVANRLMRKAMGLPVVEVKKEFAF
jgi:hypothetical protein